MRIFQLEAEERLSKTYTKADGGLTKAPYPMVKPFKSHEHEVENIVQFYDLLRNTIEDPYKCLVKGILGRALKGESRAGATDANTPTQWMCLDLDYVFIEDEDHLEDLLVQLGLGNVSYAMQYGAGHKIDKDFSAHLFFMLDKPVRPSQLKNWLMHLNLTNPLLESAITLTKTDCALSWPLDITLSQNDKLIYTAPPKCIGFADPVADRVKYCGRKNDVAVIAKKITRIRPNAVEAQKTAKLNELRKEKGLPRKNFKPKSFGSIKVLNNPDRVTVTGVKNERGFTYINLNGGDSWGYYFPQENPEVVYNFKGEPNYLLSDLDPDFYSEYKKALTVSGREGRDKVPFAFLDRRTDKYFRGIFYPETEQLEIYPTDSIRKLTDFAKQNELVLGDYVEEWDYQFRFDQDVVFDADNQFINRYRRTPFLQRALGDEPLPSDIPPTISRVIHSVVGNDPDCVVHFLNWLACIVQHRQRTQSAWVFTGREGTGKGVLFNYVLAPLFGPEYCRTTRLATLEEDFNGFMEDCVILMIDESKTTQIKNYEKVMSLLKNVIVEPRIQIRRMRTDAYMVPNYLNLIVASNHPDAIHISPTDRRFNVGNYQANKLFLDEHDIEAIQNELWDFARILRSIKTDTVQAKTPLENEARRRMMYLTETSISISARSILEGNLEFFIDSLPSEVGLPTGADVTAHIMADRYVAVLREAEQAAHQGLPMRMTREQCKILMEYVVGDVPKTANKFTNFMKHYGVFFKRKRKEGSIVQCIDIEWKKPTVQIDDYIDEDRKRLKAIK